MVTLEHKPYYDGEFYMYKKMLTENDPSLKSLKIAHNLFPHRNNRHYIKSLFKNLARNTTLVKFTIYNTNLLESEAELLARALEVNTKIEDLEISCNCLTSKGMVKIIKALQKNNTLTKLNFNCNKVNSEGAIILGDILRKNKRLSSINLQCNDIDYDGIQYLRKSLEDNYTLKTLEIAPIFINGDLVWKHPELTLIEKLLERNHQILDRKKEFYVWCFCLNIIEQFLPLELKIIILKQLIYIHPLA